MEITDAGLEHILSLGLFKETDEVGIYDLYSWKGVSYCCGLSAPLKKSDKVFIRLSQKQLELLPIKKSLETTDKNLLNHLRKSSEYFETIGVFKFLEESNSVHASEVQGKNQNLLSLKVDLNMPSPFKILKETRNSYHGFYAPLPYFSELLEAASFKTEKLWISAHPILKDGKFTGAIIGFTEGSEYGLDALEIIKASAIEHAA